MNKFLKFILILAAISFVGYYVVRIAFAIMVYFIYAASKGALCP